MKQELPYLENRFGSRLILTNHPPLVSSLGLTKSGFSKGDQSNDHAQTVNRIIKLSIARGVKTELHCEDFHAADWGRINRCGFASKVRDHSWIWSVRETVATWATIGVNILKTYPSYKSAHPLLLKVSEREKE